MKKLSILLSFMLIASLGMYAQKTTYGFDKAHTNVRFTISHMVITEVDGNFSDFEGKVVTTKEDFSDADISFTIQVASINTDDDKRDEHLRSPDFFDVANHPEITFKSTSMEKVSDKKYKLSGDLTMHGVTKNITLDVKYGGTIVDPWGNTKAGFKLTGEINRLDWGLKYNSVMDSGGLLIGEEVGIVCNVQLIKL
ncbi:MAG: polyisoprenoid-binding protein [Marinilabiliales bacterium]|nr:MAG: polyisoprenoid-binding protein [Marinilabiliales bacterium]